MIPTKGKALFYVWFSLFSAIYIYGHGLQSLYNLRGVVVHRIRRKQDWPGEVGEDTKQ